MTEFDAYKAGYEEEINRAIKFGGKAQDFYTSAKADFLNEMFSRDLAGRDALEILDVGCGAGAIHPLLLSSNLPLKLTGVEVSHAFLETARQANPLVHYDSYDGERLPYEADRFDAAFAICVMHHVPAGRWANFLREMRRVVRPQGRVTIIEHNPLNPLTAHIVKSCPFDRDAVLLGAGTLGRIMEEVGLRALTRRYILFTPFEGALPRRFDRAMGWLPLGAQYVQSGLVPAA